MKTTAIVLAAGSGKRVGGTVKKQYLDLGGHPVLFHSLQAFHESIIDEIILVTGKDELEENKDIYLNSDFPKIKAVVAGGKERYHSVYSGLCAAEGADYVFIHDSARPFIDNEIISRCLKSVMEDGACVAAMPSKDTVKIADEDGYVQTTPDRSKVWIIQTPQCFEYKLIYEAHKKLIEAEEKGILGNLNVTDDAMVAEHFAGARVKLVEGSYNNIKITTPEDLPLARNILSLKKDF